MRRANAPEHMNKDMTLIRTATASDAEDLAALAESTFRATFSAQNSPEDMNLHCQAHYGKAIQLRELLDPGIVTLVAQAGDRLVAFAQLRWGDAPVCVGDTGAGEIQRLYLDKNFHGKGLAHKMMEACLQLFATRKTALVWLGVWEHNPRAIAFYKKCGFAEAGAHVFPLGTDLQRDIILARPVGDIHSPAP